MPRHSQSIIRMATVLFILFFFNSCSQRYPFFIQIPEFVVTETEESVPGIMLNIVCEDENAVIRYTSDGSQPSEVHGLVYEESLYLVANSVFIQAVAVRVGYPAGPIAEFYFEPQD